LFPAGEYILDAANPGLEVAPGARLAETDEHVINHGNIEPNVSTAAGARRRSPAARRQ
jgi:hypothetical protein